MANDPKPFTGSNYPIDEFEDDQEDNKLESKGLRGSNKVTTQFAPTMKDKFGRAVTGNQGYKQTTIEPIQGYVPDMDFSKSK